MVKSQFEAKKVALKQTKDGHVLTLAIHPDESPDEILRDFVGSRYMVVMVRLGDDEKPYDREEHVGAKFVKIAGMLCRDPNFWDWLYEDLSLQEQTEDACVEWLTTYLNISSRSELKTNKDAQETLSALQDGFNQWKTTKST